MSVRVECDVEGLTGDWVEIQDAGWGRRDTVHLASLPDDDSLYRFLLEREKLIACHVTLVTGQVISEPSEMTEDAMLDADEATIAWLGRAAWLTIAKRRALGNVSARLSLPANG